MKKTNMLLFIAALLVAGCVKEQPKNEVKEYSRANFDTVYNEIITVMDMYSDTAVANDYLCEQIKKLSVFCDSVSGFEAYSGKML